jgi:hypothetical protein
LSGLFLAAPNGTRGSGESIVAIRLRHLVGRIRASRSATQRLSFLDQGTGLGAHLPMIGWHGHGIDRAKCILERAERYEKPANPRIANDLAVAGTRLRDIMVNIASNV